MSRVLYTQNPARQFWKASQRGRAGVGLTSMRTIRLVAILGAGTALAGPARAETAAPVVALDEISVTATRAPRRIEDVPQSVQVVDRDQIRQQLALTSSPSAVLSKLVPGFSVPNGTISSASESFRGRNLLVLIDGVPVNTPLRDVSRILNLIDSIRWSGSRWWPAPPASTARAPPAAP